MSFVLAIVVSLFAGILDRVRGGWPEGRHKAFAHAATIGAGALMTCIVSTDWRLVLAGALLVGELSWRQDNGWRGKWLRGEGRFVDALRWGGLWAAPLMFFAWVEPWFLVYGLTAPAGACAAIWLSMKLPATRVMDLRHAWPWSELLELPIIGMLTALVMHL